MVRYAVSTPFVIEWHHDTAAITQGWAELARETRAAPFLWPDWIEAWCDSFGKGRVAIAVARRDGKLAAVLPLQRSRGVLTSPTNWHTPLFGAVGENRAAVTALIEAVFDERPHRLSLSFVDLRDPLLEVTREAAAGAGYRTLDEAMLRSPYLQIDGEWTDVWQGLGSKRRNTINRRRRRLKERGEVELSVSGGGDLDELLGEALRVEALGWKGTRGTAIASDPATDRFYRRVAASAAALGAFRLAQLRVDGRLVAFDYVIECNGHSFLLKTGFDPEFRDCAPGIVLRAMMIERAFSNGTRWYEFLGAEDPYKREWTETSRERRRLHAFAPSAAGLSHLAAFRYGRPVAKRALRWRNR